MNYFFVADGICKYDLSVFPRATFLQVKNEDEIIINYIQDFYVRAEPVCFKALQISTAKVK